MSNVIELEDSDDELLMPVILEQNLCQLPETAASISMDCMADETTSSEMETKQNTSSTESISAAINNEDSMNAPPALQASTSVQPRARHHRRKSLHQMVRSSPDMEFEMLPFEMEDTKKSLAKNRSPGKLQKRTHKTSNTSPKILLSKQPTPEEIFNEDFQEFLNDDKTMDIIRNIAAERLRMNALLTLNGMPEINFSLYTQPERLRFQLDNRFKQRKIQQQNEASPPS